MKIGNTSYTLPQIALLLANLIPVFGVLYMDWDVGAIVVLYWAENLVVGIYTILKMLVADGAKAIGFALFFCVHYGGFCVVHGMFVLKLTEFAGIASLPEPESTWPGPLVIVEKAHHLISSVLSAAPGEILWVLLAMVLSHGVSFLLLFIGQGEYRDARARRLMTAPYERIAVLHVAVILGGFLVARLQSPIGLLLALVALKIGMDIILHNRSHRRHALAEATSGQEKTGT
ncbi:MAG: DUF6498-containing protein [Thiohalobacterales bacterium]|nr:DUF6498-containing protein [Thiohalobacterales bacterium]